MKMLLKKWPMLLLAAATMTMISCSEDEPNTQNNEPKTVASTIEGDSRFTIFAEAMSRTNTTSAMSSSNGKVTAFVPNDAAFQAYFTSKGYADLDDMEADMGSQAMANFVLYHITAAEVRANQVTTGYVTSEGKNADGDKLSIFTRNSGSVTLNGNSSVEDADIEASNGVIHEMSAVLEAKTTAELISLNTEAYSSLTAALGTADGNLIATLSSNAEQKTVFAPDNAAFSALLTATSSATLGDLVANIGGTAVLADILLYHVVDGNVRAEDLQSGTVATASGNATFTVNVGSTVTITDAAGNTCDVTETNIQGTNGVVHRTNAVLLLQ